MQNRTLKKESTSLKRISQTANSALDEATFKWFETDIDFTDLQLKKKTVILIESLTKSWRLASIFTLSLW